MNPKPTMDAMVHLWGKLDFEQRVKLLDQAMFPRIRRLLDRAIRREAENTFITPLNDNDVIHLLGVLKKVERKEALRIIASWRRLATELGYPGYIAWQVRAGFTLKTHGPKAGPCCGGAWKTLQSWDLKNDEPTKESIVFWIPRLLPDSLRKDTESQQKLLSEVRIRFELPVHHLEGFGSAALYTALIQAHAKRTGERTPLHGDWVRTDTLAVHNYRLCLTWSGNGFYCSNWHDSGPCADLGVFPLGVEALGEAKA